jgi:hypothetical protein
MHRSSCPQRRPGRTARPGNNATVEPYPEHTPWKAFFPGGNAYLGRVAFGEPQRQSDVLSPNRRYK